MTTDDADRAERRAWAIEQVVEAVEALASRYEEIANAVDSKIYEYQELIAEPLEPGEFRMMNWEHLWRYKDDLWLISSLELRSHMTRLRLLAPDLGFPRVRRLPALSEPMPPDPLDDESERPYRQWAAEVQTAAKEARSALRAWLGIPGTNDSS